MVNIKMVRKMRKYIILIAIATAIVSFLLGLYLYKLNQINEQIAFEAEYGKIQSENIINEAENIIKETSMAENKTSPNTKLYTLCCFCFLYSYIFLYLVDIGTNQIISLLNSSLCVKLSTKIVRQNSTNVI